MGGGDDDGGGRGDGGGPGGDGGGGGDAGLPVFGCPALPAPDGDVIEVTPDQAGELPDIVRGAVAGDTVSLADGTYPLPATLQMAMAGVTLRSKSGDASAVILDAGYTVAEAVQVSASEVTIAHLTITRAIDHPVHVVAPDGGPDATTRSGPRSSGSTPASGSSRRAARASTTTRRCRPTARPDSSPRSTSASPTAWPTSRTT